MKKFNKILALYLLVAFPLSNIGLPLFSQYCYQKNKLKFTLELKSCCCSEQSENNIGPIFSNPCCEFQHFSKIENQSVIDESKSRPEVIKSSLYRYFNLNEQIVNLFSTNLFRLSQNTFHNKDIPINQGNLRI